MQSLEAVIAAGFAADNGIKQFVRAVIALEQAAVSVAGVASRPSRELVRVAIKHALFHQLVPIRHLLGAEFPVASIPQNQRKPLNEYCIQWERGIRQALQAVIDGKPEPIIDDEIDEVEYVEKMQNGHDQESL